MISSKLGQSNGREIQLANCQAADSHAKKATKVSTSTAERIIHRLKKRGELRELISNLKSPQNPGEALDNRHFMVYNVANWHFIAENSNFN